MLFRRNYTDRKHIQTSQYLRDLLPLYYRKGRESFPCVTENWHMECQRTEVFWLHVQESVLHHQIRILLKIRIQNLHVKWWMIWTQQRTKFSNTSFVLKFFLNCFCKTWWWEKGVILKRDKNRFKIEALGSLYMKGLGLIRWTLSNNFFCRWIIRNSAPD